MLILSLCHPQVRPLCSNTPVHPGQARLEAQHELCRTPQPGLAPACGGHWTAGQHVVQTRGWLTPAVGALPHLSQLRVATHQLARAPARYDPMDGDGQKMATADARHGRWPDGSGVEPARGADVSCAAVAAGPGKLRIWRGQ